MGPPEAKACAEKREEHTPSALRSATKGGPGLASPVPSTTIHSGRAWWAENLRVIISGPLTAAQEQLAANQVVKTVSRIATIGAPLRSARLSSFQGLISANLQLTAIGARCRGAHAEASTRILAILDAETTNQEDSEPYGFVKHSGRLAGVVPPSGTYSRLRKSWRSTFSIVICSYFETELTPALGSECIFRALRMSCFEDFDVFLNLQLSRIVASGCIFRRTVRSRVAFCGQSSQ